MYIILCLMCADLNHYLKRARAQKFGLNSTYLKTSTHNEWYIGNVLVCAHFSSKLAHGTYCLCSIMQLFRLVVIRGYVPQGAGFYTRYYVYVIQWQRALVVYMSLGQLES